MRSDASSRTTGRDPDASGFGVRGGAGEAVRVLLLLAVCLATASVAAAQEPASLTGRIMDRETGNPVGDAVVSLSGLDDRALTDREGLFAFDDVPGGSYELRIRHLAYGEQTDSVTVEPGTSMAIRVAVAQEAIELEPVVVEVLSDAERASRGRGSAIHSVSREQIEEAMRSSKHLGDILRQEIPGLEVRDTNFLPGAQICLRFRGVNSVMGMQGCQTPTVLLDGVRLFEPSVLLTTVQASDVERIELIPAGEAGVLFGTGVQRGSNAGVLIVETRLGPRRAASAVPRSLRGPVTYDWSLERAGHSWKKTFAGAFLGNAAGMALGLVAARNCLDVGALAHNIFATSCSDLSTAASWGAALGFPTVATSLAVRFGGDTEISRGRFLPAAMAATMFMVPGYVLSTTSTIDDFAGSRVVGGVFLAVGVPAAATLADHLFRSLK